MAMKMFMNMKLSMMKDLSERIEKENLMTDDLKIFFEKELDEIKDNGKMMCKSMNKLNKKRANSSTTEESDESDETAGSKKKLKKEKKEKRAPTEHQSRVSKCMVVLKERYSQVKHQIRLGTANYMATFIKNEFTDIDFDTELDKVEQALTDSIKRMNEKKQSEVYPVDSEQQSDEKKENKKPVAAEEPSSSMTNKKNTDKKQKKEKKKVEEKESDDEEEEEEKEVVKETKEQNKKKMDDLLKELEEMNNESDDEEESDDEDAISPKNLVVEVEKLYRYTCLRVSIDFHQQKNHPFQLETVE